MAGLVQESRGAAELFFEVAREMGKLLVAEVQSDAFDGVACNEFLVSDLEAIVPEPFAQSDAVRFFEVALNGARANAAHSRKLARLEVGGHSQGFPIERRSLVERTGKFCCGRMIGRNHGRGCWVARSVRVARNSKLTS